MKIYFLGIILFLSGACNGHKARSVNEKAESLQVESEKSIKGNGGKGKKLKKTQLESHREPVCIRRQKVTPESLDNSTNAMDMFGKPTFIDSKNLLVIWNSTSGGDGIVRVDYKSHQHFVYYSSEKFIDYFSSNSTADMIAFILPIEVGSRQKNKVIWLYDKLKGITTQAFKTEGYWNGKICWRPQSDRFAMVENEKLYVFNVNKNFLDVVLTGDGIQSCVGWSEDGSDILYLNHFDSANEDSNLERHQVVEFKVDSKRSRVLFETDHIGEFVWHSKTGNLFYKNSSDNIYKVHIFGKSATSYSEELFLKNYTTEFDISPDEKCAVFAKEFSSMNNDDGEENYWSEIFMDCLVDCSYQVKDGEELRHSR